ncbi:MAG: protocatechuate 3,4-dioxygenase [Pseudomonadota bacterium]
MTNQPNRISRRIFTGAAIGSVAALAGASRSLAQGMLPPTAHGPEGPFFPVEFPADSDADLTHIAGRGERAAGQVIEVHGRVLDRLGNPIEGARLQLWQANAAGRYHHPGDVSVQPLDPNFQSYADLRTDRDGNWRIITVKPGAYDSPIGHRTPHIHGRAGNDSTDLTTQMYFSDEAELNAADGLFRRLGSSASTAIAQADTAQPHVYRWTIILDRS